MDEESPEHEEDVVSDYLKILIESITSIQKNLEGIDSELSSDGELDQNGVMENEVIIRALNDQINIWMNWFYSTLVYLLLINLLFFTSIIDPWYQFLPITLVILFPLYLWWAFLQSIPTIVIDGEVVFSRELLTLRRQILLGRKMTVYFAKETVRNFPLSLPLLSGAVLLLFYVTIRTYLL